MAYAFESWRPVADFPDYLVSDRGRIMRVTRGGNNFVQPGRVLKTRIERNGYERVGLYNENGVTRVTVHAVVCRAFHGPPPSPHHEVAHRDGSRDNNHASNLRWLTRSQNQAEKRRHGTAQTGRRNGGNRHSPETIRKVRNDPRPLKVVAAELGLNYTYAWAIKHRRVWRDVA